MYITEVGGRGHWCGWAWSLMLSHVSNSSPSHSSCMLFVQTYIGSILSAVNPYKFVDNVYGPDIMQQYMKRQLGDLPPHIYAIANEVYESMWRMGENQCVLIR